MTQVLVTQEGCFDLGAKDAVNSNFTQLFSQQADLLSLTSSATLDSSYAQYVLKLNSAAGMTLTLPAATNSGIMFRIVATTSVTSNNYILKVANASDTMQGVAMIGASGGTSELFGTASTSDTITMNGTTTGGLRGSYIEIRDVASNLWQVRYHGVGSGVAATPFSATV